MDATRSTEPVAPVQTDAVLAASRVLVGVVARSVAQVDDQVTLPQLRVLVMVARHGPLNLNTVAQVLGVHASNATRTCDRLVGLGLLDRREALHDRRHLSLTLTKKGSRLVASVMDNRRKAITAVLARMAPAERGALTAALSAFAEAADEDEDDDLLAWGS